MKALFGTDGIRGEVGKYPLTQEAVFTVGRALGLWLKEQFPKPQAPLSILIGKDTRESGDELELALGAGAQSEGLRVQRAGVCPTPTVAYLTRALSVHLGVAISASHNPGSDNGIKLFNSKGYKLFPVSERRIEEIFARFSPVDKKIDCKLENLTEESNYIPLYLNFAKGSLKGLGLSGFTIVLDCAFGSFSKIAPQAFKELGATVYTINGEPDGKNINVNCGTLYPQMMSQATLQHKANIGIAFDGDGDRVIVADEEGNILDGDYILAILSKHYLKTKRLKSNFVVCTQMSNIGLELYLQSQGIQMIRAKVGDKYVLEEMLKHKASLGGEQSGHIILLERTTTGDGLITALELIEVMLEEKKPLSKLSENLQRFPQVLVNVKVNEKRPFGKIPDLNARIEHCQERLGKTGRILVRYSGTEKLARVMVEGKRKEEVCKIAETLAKTIRDAVGEK